MTTHDLDLFTDAAAARASDPVTSKAAANDVRIRARSQRGTLLRAFVMAGEHGLTDEEAAYVTRLVENRSACWWKRCSDLRELGLIAPTGDTRPGSAGSDRMVCVVTEDGLRVADGWAE
jgi:hypothetical protein